jgi:hypothetical protein
VPKDSGRLSFEKNFRREQIKTMMKIISVTNVTQIPDILAENQEDVLELMYFIAKHLGRPDRK